MNVQPMALGINQLKIPQKPSLQGTNRKKEDDFSSVLEKSREKQETPSKTKVNKEKVSTNKVAKESDTTESKTADTKEASEPTESIEVSKPKESTPEDQVTVEDETAKMMENIAKLLQITTTELEQVLANLQIGISDLLKGDNLQQLIMQVHNVEEPMDLLLIPEVASEIKAITSMVEEYVAKTAVTVPEEQLLESITQEIPLGQPENKVKVETQGVNQSNEKSVQSNAKLETDSKVVEVDQGKATKVDVTAPSNEELPQNKEQSTPNQNNSANQFLDHLSQSIGEAFQWKSEQVNQVAETIVTRHEPVNPRMVLDQIVEKIKVSTMDEQAQMSIRLKPEHLGKLSMEVISKQGVMTAHFTVENEKTKLILEQQMAQLKESLEGQGLVIEQLEVTVGQNQTEDRQTYKSPKSAKSISDMINNIMNEDHIEEDIKANKILENETSEVNFIA